MPPADRPPHDAPAAANADAPEPQAKKGLFGWLSGAVSNLEGKGEGATGKLEARSPSGPLTPAKSPSGPLGGPVRSASLKLPGTGPIARAPQRASQTGDLVPPAPTPVATPS
ncbi:MAG: hypothetical protein JWM80_1344, partial [Cyanobacteria bacterium RYN_339]|nr:hypothetical protein [Cyanobacteria bacterium RYN_339]